MYTKDIAGNVPLYGQMSRNGYPNPSDRLFYTQLYLWNSIQGNNSIDPADARATWATDPHGLQGCLQSLANPIGVHWAEFSETDRNQLLFHTLYWMNRRGFPAPTLVHQGDHWVVIVGWTTDVEPIAGSSPLLQSIHYFDPEPLGVGTDTTMGADEWYDGPWDVPVLSPGTWLNKYVAIIEPPITQGAARVKPRKPTGGTLLTPDEAIAKAKGWIGHHGLAAMPKYGVLGRKDVEVLPPLLVREEPPIPHTEARIVRRARGRRRADNVSYYYVVPFGISGERSSTGSPLARVCVLVDGYTGAFDEVTAFGRPLAHLTKVEALSVVAAALHLSQRALAKVDATLMFRPGEITHIRTYPFWQVQVGDRTLYVDQLGKLYGKLMPATPGD
jgi:hypothetical protein